VPVHIYVFAHSALAPILGLGGVGNEYDGSRAHQPIDKPKFLVGRWEMANAVLGLCVIDVETAYWRGQMCNACSGAREFKNTRATS
jgi:hypothetical protein